MFLQELKPEMACHCHMMLMGAKESCYLASVGVMSRSVGPGGVRSHRGASMGARMMRNRRGARAVGGNGSP